MKIFFQGTFWLSIGKFLNQVFSLIFFVILARLLDPSEFGKSALLFSYLTIIHAFFRPLEFNWIQYKEQKRLDLTLALLIAFVFSFAIGLLIFLLFNIFHAYELLNLEVYDSYDFFIIFSLITSCLLMILRGELSKRNEFKQLSFYNLISLTIGTSIAPILLVFYIYPSYKFLLLGLVLSQLLEIILITSKLRLFLFFSFPSRNHILRISKILFIDYKKLTTNSIVGKVALNGDYLVIGSALNSYSLGIYNKAYDLLSKPLNILADSIQKVIISQGQIVDSENKLINYFNSVATLNCIFIIPLSIIINIISPIIFTFLLGEKWSSIGELISNMSWILFFLLNRKITNSILLLRRKVSILIKINLIYGLLILATTALLIDYGLNTIGTGITGVVFVMYLISIFYLVKIIKINSSKIIRGFLLPMIIIFLFVLIKLLLFHIIKFSPTIAGLCSFFMIYSILILIELFIPTYFSLNINFKNFYDNKTL